MAGKDRVASLKTAYEEIQKKTFTKWANSQLQDRDVAVSDLYHDLRDGSLLLLLLHKLSGASVVWRPSLHLQL